VPQATTHLYRAHDVRLGRVTNNLAEYAGLLMGLEKLRELSRRAVSLLRQFDSYRIVHVRREFSKLAGRMANRDIDEAVKKALLRAKVDQAIALRAPA
jgi:ribonuclease HI